MSNASGSAGWPPLDDAIPRTAWQQALRRQLAPAHTLVLALIFLGALVVAWAVLPGEDERIEALERDGQKARALSLLEARFNRGDQRQRTLVNLRRFYEYYGDSPKAQQMLELLALQRPRDLYIQRQLAQWYRVNQNLPGQIRALQAQLSIRYSEPVCQRLIGLLHLSSDYSGEQATLISCHNNGYRRPEGLERLAALYATDGKLDLSAKILGAVDDRRWLRGSHERLMLFDALMSANQPKEALRRGIRWYKGQPNPDLALEMIARLVAAEHNDLGLQMARDIGTPGDPVTLAAGEILVDQEQFEAARAFLTGWLAQSKPMNTETAIRFVTAAVDAGDPALAMQAAEHHGLNHFQSTELLPLAEALIAASQISAFDTVRALLTPESIQTDGLVGAAIELRAGEFDAARATLLAVTVDPADERRAVLKTRLLALAGRPPAPTRLVREPAHTRIVLTPPVVTVSPGETQARRLAAPVEVAKRFKRRRLATKPAAAQTSSKPKPSILQLPSFFTGQ